MNKMKNIIQLNELSGRKWSLYLYFILDLMSNGRADFFGYYPLLWAIYPRGEEADGQLFRINLLA
ncbi:hypothetical protein [Methylobacterium gossipiicola]|uniref:hypothetical protein n=1 Tax=Methylobacterium gossipiicola TaxID=582675 RepID=UPI001160DD3C|nr:hypothetical protein [Methylobacterium gossipiicola]